MRRTTTVKQSSNIGARAQIFRKHLVRSRAVMRFMKPRRSWNRPPLLVFLFAAGVLGGCRQESRIPSRPPTPVRLAVVTTAQTRHETVPYLGLIIPVAQVDLAFRTSGYVAEVM